jgi:hypothetical protein
LYNWSKGGEMGDSRPPLYKALSQLIELPHFREISILQFFFFFL